MALVRLPAMHYASPTASPATPRIGTAGWSVASGEARLFAGEGSHLQRYGQILNAVEINTSFYRPHRRQTYERWAASVPSDFRFSVKMPRTITHEARLRDCQPLIDRFVDETAGLGEKLAVLLVQLPPSLAFDPAIVDTFLEQLRTHTGTAIVCEPRHRSWFCDTADRLLAAHGVGRVAADPSIMAEAAVPGGSDALIYYRLHGSPRIYHSSYDGTYLAALAQRLRSSCATGRLCWCIFDNTAQGAALDNALELLSRGQCGPAMQ